MLFFQFAGDLTMAVEEAKQRQVVMGKGREIKVACNQDLQ